MAVCAFHPSYTEAINRKIMVQVSPEGKTQEPIPKTNKAKKKKRLGAWLKW
jgi:hypothetical protein